MEQRHHGRPAVSALVRFTVALAVAVGINVSVLGNVRTAFAATCATDGNHWYARADSGSPDIGTRILGDTPASWHVDGTTSTMDEAAWIINNSNPSIAIEGGYFSGYWPYAPTGWYSGLVSYYTLDNGSRGTHGPALNPSSGYITVLSGGSVNVMGAGVFSFSYTVNNGRNSSQGEVTTSTKTWMGNGTGNSFAGWWSNNGSNWYSWGWHNDCNNSPYWITSQGAYQWTNGGHN